MVQYDCQGRAEVLAIPERAYESELDFSPDGRFLALVDTRANFDIWLWDLERQILSRLTRGGNNQAPTWGPDSKSLIFATDRRSTDGKDLYWTPIDGSGPEEVLYQFEETVWPGSWSADGRHLVYSKEVPGHLYDLWMLPIGEDKSAGTP